MSTSCERSVAPRCCTYSAQVASWAGVVDTGQRLVRISLQHLLYGFTSVLVADAVADVVLEYAVALNDSRLSDLVTVPTTDQSGYPSKVRMLLAPGVPLMTEPAPDDDLEHEHRGFVAGLRTRIVAVLAVRAVPRASTA